MASASALRSPGVHRDDLLWGRVHPTPGRVDGPRPGLRPLRLARRGGPGPGAASRAGRDRAGASGRRCGDGRSMCRPGCVAFVSYFWGPVSRYFMFISVFLLTFDDVVPKAL